MPKASVIQTNFSAGEVSPLTLGRVQTPRYKESLTICQNYLPILQGALVRRPGTKYVAPVKDPTNPPTLIPFKFSITQAYMLEFGNHYIRFYANGGQIISPNVQYQIAGAVSFGTGFPGVFGGSPIGNFFAIQAANNNRAANFSNLTSTATTAGTVLELTTDYAIADVPNIRYAQNANTLYLVHPNYPVRKLVRYAQTEWTLQDVYLQDGPYLNRNSYLTSGDSTGIQFAGNPSTPQGCLIVTSPSYNISGAANNGSGLIRITTSSAHTYTTGQKVFITGVGGTTEANNSTTTSYTPTSTYWTITYVDSTHFDLQGSAFVHTYTSNGQVFPALFDMTQVKNTGYTRDTGRPIRIDIAGSDYFGNITQVLSAAEVSVTFDLLNSIPPGSFTSVSWLLGVYDNISGFPSCVSYHQSRLVLAGAPQHPQQIDGSSGDIYENFRPSQATTLTVTDADAYQFVLASTDVDAVKWLRSSTQGLLAGTYSSEWLIASSANNEALSPLNVNATLTNAYGSANVDAVQMGNASLYVQRSGRKLRELSYYYQIGTFRSSDLTELSEHITLPGLTKLAACNETQPTVWGLRSDGQLVCVVYDRDLTNITAGWARHPLGGQSDTAGSPPIVNSISSIPSQDTSYDQLWLVVNRYINGQNVCYVEYLTKMFDSSFLTEDAYHLDCGTTYDVPITITNINISSGVQVTAPAHGLSVGNTVILNGVLGLNLTTTDINGGVTITNLVNYLVYTVGTVVDANNVLLVNSDGSAITTTGYSSYVSDGQMRKRVTTISGLTWLEGETVSMWSDGAFGGTATISSGGVLTLPSPAGKVQIGYTYTSQAQTVRPEAGAADGTSIGKTRRPNRASLMMYRVAEMQMGTNFNRMLPIAIIAADNVQAGVAFPLFTGIRRQTLEAEYNFEGQLCFQQMLAGPGTILSGTLFMEEEDV